MSRQILGQRLLYPFMVGLMIIIAATSLGRILTKERTGIDFFSLIWYPGHFLWQRADPYGAALTKLVPSLPIRYWDGHIATEFIFVIDPMPTNLAPVVIIFAPLARLSWSNALTAWLVINLLMIIVIVYSVIRLLGCEPFSRQGLIILLLAYSLIATREALETGQTTIFVLACMLAALVIGTRSQSVGGILLGIALSKYSLTFPGLLYFLCRRWYKGFVISLSVLLIGTLLIALISKVFPYQILIENFRLMLMHSGMPGLHLSATLLKGLEPWSVVMVALFSLGLLIAIFYLIFQNSLSWVKKQPAAFMLLVITMQWNLLALPHRRYDHVAEILFLSLSILWSDENSLFALAPKQLLGLRVFTGLAASVWILPWYYLLGREIYLGLFSCCSLITLVISVFLLFKVVPSQAMSALVNN
jgi:hypothetical protein